MIHFPVYLFWTDETNVSFNQNDEVGSEQLTIRWDVMDGHVWRPVPLSHMMGKRSLKMNSFFPKHSRFPISTRMMLHCSGGRTVQPLPHHFLLFVPTTIYCIEASLMSQQKEQPAIGKLLLGHQRLSRTEPG